MIMTKTKPVDPFNQYLTEQVSEWKDKIEDIEDDIERYMKRQVAVMKQLSFYRVKLKSLAECKKECINRLESAEKRLASLTPGKEA